MHVINKIRHEKNRRYLHKKAQKMLSQTSKHNPKATNNQSTLFNEAVQNVPYILY